MTETRNAYLHELRTELACFARARELALEVADHLADSTAKLQAEGRSSDDASFEAMARLGSPHEIAEGFARQGEPLAVPTRFTRAAGWAAIVSLPFWGVTFGAVVAAGEVERRTGEWAGPSQLLWGVGMLAMLMATATLVVASFGLSRREGGLGKVGRLAIALLVMGFLLTPISWLVPAWTTVLALGVGALALALHRRNSAFSRYGIGASIGTALVVASWIGLAVAGGGNESYDGWWRISFGIMLLPAAFIALIGFMLVREPSIPVPARAAS